VKRASHEWFVETAVTGRWWEPPFWEHPEYLADSPWSAARLSVAFKALKTLYTEQHAKAAFSWVAEPDVKEGARLRNRPLWPLLACPNRADLSALVRLGLDAADADVFAHPELVRKLREDITREFKGARFELRCLAAFCNASIKVDYEPLAGTGKSPDFGLKLQGQLYIDAKHAEEGVWAKEEQQWFWKVSMPARPTSKPISAHVRLTEAFRQLQDHEDGRTYIRANIDRLASLVNPTKERLATSGGPFPAIDAIEGLIEVEVMAPPDAASSGSARGVPTDTRREVARVVRGAVARGATQIPSNELGIVLLNPGLHAPTHLLVDEVRRWMRAEGEGAGYPNLIGVLVLAEMIWEPVKGVMGSIDGLVPIWRDEAPDWVQRGPWETLSEALSMQDYETLVHRCARATATGDLPPPS
jgi:hypothetical protein